jgi:hypothetical protein
MNCLFVRLTVADEEAAAEAQEGAIRLPMHVRRPDSVSNMSNTNGADLTRPRVSSLSSCEKLSVESELLTHCMIGTTLTLKEAIMGWKMISNSELA